MLRRVLIIDNNDVNRRVLKNILGNDYDTIEADDGRDALALMRAAPEAVSAVLLNVAAPAMDGYGVLRHMRGDPNLAPIPVIVTIGSTDTGAEVEALSSGADDYITQPYNPAIIRHRLQNTIRFRETAAFVNAATRDKLTGLYNRETFFEKAAELVAAHEPGYYVLACLDIDNFKVINDQYGSEIGDRVLTHVANTFLQGFGPVGGICCRIMADIFAVLYPRSLMDSGEASDIRRRIATLDGTTLAVTVSIGYYVVDEPGLSVSAMYDRASMAKASVKGRFDVKIARYDESMRKHILHEQEIVNEMYTALKTGQFEAWFQPQYNHSTGALIGAEALVRWRHPERGLISPGEFIPVFERNGFIYELDKYIWEQVCILLRKWIDEERSPLPVSVNISRRDMLRPDLFDTITGLLTRYRIPVELLRLEITESAFARSTHTIIDTVQRFVDYGFTVEIDDFGSGYSSLNTLKDVPANVLKLDMRFLEGTDNSQRGGNIIESIVRMAKWLGMPVIAEGVETLAQADYLKSIGCSYIQGYLYARPMPVDEYEALARNAGKEEKMLALETVENLDNNAFWDPKSMDTLIFNSYVGGACIFEYHDGNAEVLRANDKYARILGGKHSISVEDALKIRWTERLSLRDRACMRAAIRRAIDTGDDASCEVMLPDASGGDNDIYLRASMRVIANAGDRYLLYCTNESITAQREAEQKERASSEQLRAIMDNINGGVSAVTVASDGAARFIFSNDQYYSTLGYTREQFQAEVPRAFDVIHPDDRDRILSAMLDVIRNRAPATYEYRCIRRDGSVIYMRCNASITRIKGVSDDVLLSVTTDITELAQAAHRLRENDEQLRFLNETAHDLVAQTDDDACAASLLRRVLEYFKGDRAYVIELDYDREVSSNTYEVCAEGVASEMANLQNVPFASSPFWFGAFENNGYIGIESVDALDDSRALERELLRAQGIRSLVAVPLRRGDRLLGFIGVDDPVRRQSHIKQLEALGDYMVAILARRALSARLHDGTASASEGNGIAPPVTLTEVLESSPEMAFVKDVNLVYVCCSRTFARMVGLNSEKDIVGKTDYDLFGRELADKYRADDLNVIRSGQPLADNMELVALSDGESRYSSTSKHALRDASGKIIGIYGSGRDVTKYHAAYSRLKLLTDSIPGGIATYVCSPDGIRLTYFNDGLCGMLGYARDEYEMLSSHNAMCNVYQEDVHIILDQLAQLLQHGTPIDCTYRVYAKDGNRKWINLRGAPAERHGDTVIVNTVLYDVTLLRDAEERLRVSDEEIRVSLSRMGKMIFLYDVPTRTLTMPDAYAERHGLPRILADVPRRMSGSGLVDARDVDGYDAFYAAIARGERTGIIEARIACPNGSWPCERAEFVTIFDSDGRPVKAIISVEDVTLQREKDALAKAEKLHEAQRTKEYERLFFDAAAERYVGIIKVNMNTLDTYRINFENGAPVECDLKQKWGEFFERLIADIYPDDRASVNEKALYGRLDELPVGASVSFTYRSQQKSGAYRWYTTTLRVSVSEGDGARNATAFTMNATAPCAADCAAPCTASRDTLSRSATAFTVDINDEMIERARLKDLSEHDGLTDLFNRVKYEAMLESDYRELSSCGVLFFDVNDLKRTNDTRGHEAGDALLCQAADSIRSITNRRIHAYRYGGDEFVVIVCNAKPGELDRLLYMWKNRLSTLEAESGVACSIAAGKAWSAAPLSIDALIGLADKSMYCQKKMMKRELR